MKLKDCEIGKLMVVNDIDLDGDYCFRLREIGISEGVNLTVCQHCSFGGRLISKGSERIGIDARLADAINVSYADKITDTPINGPINEVVD